MDICPIVDRPPLLNGVFPIIMSCIARKTLLLCFRWMLTVYIRFIFIGNILAVVFTQLKNHPQYKKIIIFLLVLPWLLKYQQIHWRHDIAYGCFSLRLMLNLGTLFYLLEVELV